MIPRRRWSPVLAIAVVVATVTQIAAAPTAVAQVGQPNILIIVTDDQRAGTLPVMPAVRRWLAEGGASYPNAFATTPLCCPSRASLLTGLLAHNHGITTNGEAEAALAAVESLMLQGPLQEAGYRTGLFGKYLNGWPNDRNPTGWDRWSVTRRTTYGGHEWNLDGTVRLVERNSTPFIAGRTLDFLEEREGRGDANPWFAYVGFMAPHMPAKAPGYADEPIPPFQLTPAMRERNFRDKPPWLREFDKIASGRAERTRARQLRSLISVDDQIDRIMLRLEDLGELRDTLVVFTSDNGYLWGDHGLKGKLAPYDPSIRVPLLLRWPGRAGAGVRDERIAGLLDLAPTILSAANATFPHEMDGTDLLGAFARRRLPLEYWRAGAAVPTWRAVLTKGWIYVEYLDDAARLQGREYYELLRDPYQLSNILRDGIRGNEPDLTRLHAMVVRLASCAGSACLG